ncbi:RWD domain-containing protein 3 isoform X3 [Salvelinus fontinalis]|uniref:RWD domain-containing protein 3 isoform X3 n=1 Tax=Salvelinus fontinalis TaxID=8038 RepID=UPI0024851CB5|nr:RWD domain-containing protein 3 isoform X3 [Salvelinus fontinalis]
MSEMALDEMSVLSAIYCEKDEFELLEKSAEKGLVFRIQMKVEAATSERTLLSLLFQLPTEYPHCVPKISVSSEQLSRKQCQHIKQSLLEKASALEPDPMVHELLLWLQQNFTELTLNDQSLVEVQDEGGIHPSPENCESRCGFIRKEMQREDDENSLRNPSLRPQTDLIF